MVKRRLLARATKIAIDARAISHPQAGGFKTYSVNLVNHLVDLDYSVSYTLLVDRPDV
jgi:hypothetical protein